LAQVIDNQLEQPVGIVIPLAWDYPSSCWKSCRWDLSRERLFLIPGNSDIGYRLPLDRLPAYATRVEEIVVPPDPFEPVEALPNLNYYQAKIKQNQTTQGTATILTERIPTIKTALCLYLKNGNLAVFLPPFESIEPFLEFTAMLQDVAITLNQPILIEGYQPPYDKRVEKLASLLTPA
ncbi:MAG: transglutaminase-like family protein, partial [Saprospiraceae bacterium]|nr:transglutaminase-like family protein [Saprospiraceae bacterium]